MMKQWPAALHTLVATQAPILGLVIGRVEDRTTWRIDFTRDATPSQRAAAKAVVDTFNPDDWEATEHAKKTLEQRIADLEARTPAAAKVT